MATITKLKVDELRKELLSRGLDTTGTKPILVKRLEEAIEVDEEENKKKLNGDNKKRSRIDSDSIGSGKMYDVEEYKKMSVKELREVATSRGILSSGSKKELEPNPYWLAPILGTNCISCLLLSCVLIEYPFWGNCRKRGKINAVEEYKKMSVKELRDVATSRGISSTGSKKELVERLCAVADSQKNDSKDDLGVGDEREIEKLVTATKKGAAVLDQYLSDDIKERYHVLQQGNDIYDATLNQTNVGNNNNKFYIIQVLENDSGGNFLVYTRWGRVGAKGGTKISGPYTSAYDATAEFESKFYDKTKNDWSNRKDFFCQPKHYTWLEMDYAETGKDSSVQGQSNPVHKSQPRETKLEAPIAKFISLICDINMMRQQMMEIGYNANKLPLVIPHDFGFKKMREFVIDTPQKLKRKIEMVEALAEIEVATKLLEDNTDIQEDPLYYQYEQLRCKLVPVEVGSQEFLMIESYMKNTHAKTHSGYAVDIVQVFRASRDGETERFQKFSDTSNRMLLWHGSRLTNWAGILSQGLRIAPPEAPSTGYMFGKGVYFADMFSKSANYCYASSAAKNGVLLLCEVALGEMNELLSANYDADKLPWGKLSTKGVGATAPDPKASQILEDGVIVPLGNPKNQRKQGSLLYNEFIVYNVEQIRMLGDEGKTEKLVTATKKGAAVLDQYLSDEIKALYHVLHQGNDIYEATLNQTNVENNDNEFYIIQVLENDCGGNFLLYTRWGRVGEKGETKISGPYTYAGDATSEFERKFYEKTKNCWSNRKDFFCQPKQYAWLEMDYDENGEYSSVIPRSRPRETKLEAPIAKFISLICDINMMRQQMMEIGYNANKLPLGKLSKKTILKIENYMKNTHAKIHSGYAVDIVQVFRASRNGENERFQKFSDTSNRMLLWHGSRLTNWAGILSQGLRIAPPEAPSTGYMFGKGVYFADMFSESAIYCYASSAAKNGVLLLCEVALGDMNELLSANSDADKLPLGKLSTKAVGAMAPDFKEAQILEDGVIVPLGNPKERPKHEGNLLHNEYIVYNVEQLRMRYVIQVEFNYEI
uniref:Poly [ADP-ribose] polymerase n=1 Tax=Solanum lycopersicum TaxID=4081 RepID=A0A3Q7HSR1_SOLLC